nr:hypothetical protein [Tanacetum cinerariifolium]
GSYALSWKPYQGDSLNLPDHSLVPVKSNSYYQAFNVKSLFGEIVSPMKSQVKLKCQTRLIIKIIKHECLKPLQSRLPSTRSIQKLETSTLGEKLETSTLGEIVSLEKSNKNVNGLHPTSRRQFSICNRLNGVNGLGQYSSNITKAIKKKAQTKSPSIPDPSLDKKADSSTGQFLLTLMKEVVVKKTLFKHKAQSSQATSSRKALKIPKTFIPCKYCGFNDHHSDECSLKDIRAQIKQR